MWTSPSWFGSLGKKKNGKNKKKGQHGRRVLCECGLSTFEAHYDKHCLKGKHAWRLKRKRALEEDKNRQYGHVVAVEAPVKKVAKKKPVQNTPQDAAVVSAPVKRKRKTATRLGDA